MVSYIPDRVYFKQVDKSYRAPDSNEVEIKQEITTKQARIYRIIDDVWEKFTIYF